MLAASIVSVAVDPPATLRAIAQGEVEPGRARELGLVLEGSPGRYRISGSGPVEIILVDMTELAKGFLTQWTLGTHLPDWAATVLLVDNYVLPIDRSPDEDLLIKGMWAAAFGERVGDDIATAARRIRDSIP